MRIGKQVDAYTAISTSDAESITIRGRDLCSDLIGKMDFTAYFWFLVTGEEASDAQLAATNACLVAITEHGLVPSVQAARMTLAAAPEAWQGAVAAGLLGMGSVVAGSTEVAGRFLAAVVERGRETEGMETAARASLERLKAERGKLPGFGHPQHDAGDPRAARLLEISDALAISGSHVAAARLLESLAPEIMGRTLPINVSGAIPAVMLDAGWPAQALKAIPILARTAGLAAHLLEESQRSIGFIMSHAGDRAITYDGVPPPRL